MNGIEFFSAQTSTQIYDNRKLILSRCRRILEYSDIYLRVDAGTVYMEIWGNNLCISELGCEGIEVYGRIDSVEYSEIPGKKSGLK